MGILLDYKSGSVSLRKNCPEGTIAIAYDDNLQLIENVVRPNQTPSGESPLVTPAIRKPSLRMHLRGNQVPELIEYGGMLRPVLLQRTRRAIT